MTSLSIDSERPSLPTSFKTESWLNSPLKTPVGNILLAGSLRNNTGLKPTSRRVLGHYALIYLLQGAGIYQDVNSPRIPVSEGDMILIFPEIGHTYGPTIKQNWNEIHFVFDGPVFKLWRDKGILSPDKPVFHLGPHKEWYEIFQKVILPKNSHNPEEPLKALGRFIQLLNTILAKNQNIPASYERHEWLSKSQHLLSFHNDSGWLTVQEVASRTGLSYDNFRKLFSTHTGQSPGQFQKRRKIDYACACLYQAELSLKEIASELGFFDEFHFSKTFKKIVGCAPSEYRKKMAGQ